MLKETPARGIYSLDGKILSGGTFNPVLIMHLFFPFKIEPSGDDGLGRLAASLMNSRKQFFPAGTQEYRKVLFHLSRSYPGPIVVMEEEPYMDSTVDFFFKAHSAKGVGQRYFISTKYHDDTPMGASRRGICSLIRQFGKTKLLLAGGYLDNDRSGPPDPWELRVGHLDGCLGYSAMKIRDNLRMELKLIKGATFSRNPKLDFLHSSLP